MSGEQLLEAYPLTWPERQKRTASHARRFSAFKVGLSAARDDLMRELGLLGARHAVVSSNAKVRRDGLIAADATEPEDPGVAVYFERRFAIGAEWRPFVIACDTYRKLRWNVRAVGVTVEALRAIQRHGASEMLEQAFTGFAALPPAHRETPWWVVLGVEERARPEVIRDAYRELARIHHPDAGGVAATMAEINHAYALARVTMDVGS